MTTKPDVAPKELSIGNKKVKSKLNDFTSFIEKKKSKQFVI